MNEILLKLDKGDKVVQMADLDFINVMCDLEDKGVDVYNMAQDGSFGDTRAMHTVRLIFSTIIGEKDERKAGKMLSEHIRNGGKIEDVFNAFSELMTSGGFGESQAQEGVTEAEK